MTTIFRLSTKHFFLLLTLLSLILIILSSTFTHPQEKSLTNTNTVETKRFENTVFGFSTFKGISDMLKTVKGTYLIAGTVNNNIINIVELSQDNKKIWSKRFINGYKAKMIHSDDGSIIISIASTSREGYTIKIDQDRKTLFSIPHYFNDLIKKDDGFIGVRDGSVSYMDGSGKEVWRRIIDDSKTIRRGGARRDPKTGKMVAYTTAQNKLKMDFVLKLKDSNYVTLGVYDHHKTNITLLDSDGNILKTKMIDTHKTYLDAAIATKDGGFAFVTRRGIRFFKFDAQASLQYKKDLTNHTDSPFSYDLIEDEENYIITSSVGQEKMADIYITLLDKESTNFKSRHYHKDGFRLHPRSIIKAFDGDFLLSVDTEIHEPWIVRLLKDGTLDANLDDPTLPLGTDYKADTDIDVNRAGDILPTKTNLETKEDVLKKVTVNTTPFYGGRFREIILSKSNQYLYALTGATGFKIIDISNSKKPHLISNVLRTSSTLVIKPNYIGPTDGKAPKKETPFDYDSPWQMHITKDENKVYISDSNHGLYALDISDKSKPRLLYTIPQARHRAFALSADETKLYFYQSRKVIEIDAKTPEDSDKLFHPGKNDWTSVIRLSYDAKKLYIADNDMLLLYDIARGDIISRYKASKTIKDIAVDGDGNIDLVIASKGVESLHQESDGELSFVSKIDIAKYFSKVLLLRDKELFCLTNRTGVACLDIRDRLNPKTVVEFRDEAVNHATALTYNENDDTLLMAFDVPSLGMTRLTP